MSLQRYLDGLLESHGEQWVKDNYEEICRHEGRRVPHETISRSIRRWRRRRSNDEQMGVDHEPTPDPMTASDVKTQYDLEDYFRVPVSGLELREVRHGVWGPRSNPHHQTRVTYAPRDDRRSIEDVIALFHEMAAETPIRHARPQRVAHTSGNLLEVSIPDLHFGLLVDPEEGGGQWDTKEAEAHYLEAVNSIIAAASTHKPEKIQFLLGSDYFNADNQANTTTKGTPQDEEHLWYQTFRRGVNLAIQAVELLRWLAPVEIIVIRGNHDDERSWYMGMFLMAWYRDCEDVEVDTSANTTKYRQWGKCMIGYAHGDRVKPERWPLIMAYDAPQIWADTFHREMHIGHIHASSTKGYQEHVDVSGVEVRVLASLAGRSAWTKRAGYRNVRKAEGFIWNKERGQIALHRYNIGGSYV